jgi:hypothetical protein
MNLNSLLEPRSLLSSYFTRYQKPAEPNRLSLSSNIILSPSYPDVIFPVLPYRPNLSGNGFVSMQNSVNVEAMLDYYRIIDPESHVPMELLYDCLKEGLQAEFEEYRDMPLSGNSLCLFEDERLACRGGPIMDTVCKFRVLIPSVVQL